MKYILKDPLLVLSFLIVIILGCFIGNDISNDFVVLYVSKLTQIPARLYHLERKIFLVRC